MKSHRIVAFFFLFGCFCLNPVPGYCQGADQEPERQAELKSLMEKVKALDQHVALFNSQGRYAQAAGYAETAVTVQERLNGPEHPETAIRLYTLAEIYRNLKRFDEAIGLNERALAIREKHLGPESQKTAESLNNLALCHAKKGDSARAVPLFERALAISEKGYVNKPRFKDEPVRHKILDLIGDLALLGCPLRAKIVAKMTGHAANIKLARRISNEARY